MKSAKNLRMPFPSFTLALSRQEAGDNSIQERNASESNVEPSVDLMKTFEPRLPRYDSNWKMRGTTDEDRYETETVFEERIDRVKEPESVNFELQNFQNK